MKVLILNGSYRGANGYTAFLAGRLADGVQSAGGEVETIHLAACTPPSSPETEWHIFLKSTPLVAPIAAKSTEGC